MIWRVTCDFDYENVFFLVEADKVGEANTKAEQFLKKRGVDAGIIGVALNRLATMDGGCQLCGESVDDPEFFVDRHGYGYPVCEKCVLKQ